MAQVEKKVGLLRKSSASKKPLKEKVVLMYDEIFAKEDPTKSNPRFWDELFLMKVNLEYLEAKLEALDGEELMKIKDNINSLFQHCIEALKAEHQIRVVNSLQTLCALIRGVHQKNKPTSGFDIINLLMGFDKAERRMKNLMESLDILLCGEGSESLKSLCLKLLLCLVTVTDNISQNTILEYVMINSIFEAILQILSHPPSRREHGYDAVVLLALLVNYRKYEDTVYTSSDMEHKMMQAAYATFNELRLAGELCDVVFNAGGVEFKAHKNILCGCSPYFRALFTCGLNDSDKNLYDIPNVSPETMRLIIEYAYTWTVMINHDNVEDLIIAADYFSILSLVNLCAEFLVNQLCPENGIGIYLFTKHYYCPELQEKAYSYILQNFENIMKTSDEFFELSAEELKGILENDALNIKQEEDAFEAIVQWIEHKPASRKQDLSHLLQVVRFSLLDDHYYNNRIKTNSYIRDSDDPNMYNINIGGLSGAANPISRPRLPSTILFAIGGWSGGRPTNAIESYDVRANTWRNVTSEEERPRAYHGAAYLKGYIYVIGGIGSVDSSNCVKRFNPVEKTWQEVAPMHAKRYRVSVAVLDDNIYAMGGFDGHFQLNTVERYEPENNQWSLIAPMHEQRSSASATMLNDKIYICGGFSRNQRLFTAEVYTLDTQQWSTITPMSTRRSGVGVIAYREKIYAVGGVDGSNRLSSAEAYNPISNTWDLLPSMITARDNFGIEVVDDHLYVVGGNNGFTNICNAECYNENTNEWKNVQCMNMHRSALSCCVVPGLPNIRDYAACQDMQSDEDSSSTSSLP